MSIYIVSPDDL